MIQTLYNGIQLGVSGPDMNNTAKMDLSYLPLVHHMMKSGLQVDPSHFKKMEGILIDDMDSLTEKIRDITGYYINVASADQVADLLFDKLNLKPAKSKKTPTGKRETVDDDVLTAIQHEHPAVGLVQDYREYDKLRGTYAVPLYKLSQRVNFTEWRMFPNLKTTRVPSGRNACSEPNLLAMPNRTERGRELCEGFITKPGWVYLSVDFCLHPSTMVETFKGSVPMSSIKTGDVVLSHKEDSITWGKVTESKMMKPKKAYRITFDNNISVIASYDHKWPTQWWKTPSGKSRGTEIVLRRTEELRVGERMIPFKPMLSPYGYSMAYTQKGSFKSVYLHKLCAEAYYGPRPKGYIVHHKDEDKTNYHPDNLEYKKSWDHASEHGIVNYRKQDHTYRLRRLKDGLRNRRSYDGVSNPNSKLTDGDYEAIRMIAAEKEYNYKEIAEVFGISPAYVQEIVSKKYVSENHQIISIEYVGLQQMWGIEVEPDHTYVLSCGVVTHNSQIEPRVGAHRSGDEELIRVYENDEDIYSDFATYAFRLKDERWECGGYNPSLPKFRPDRQQAFRVCDDPEHIGHGWHYPAVDKKKHRYPAKTCTLASLYEVSGPGLLQQMPVMCGNCGKKSVDHDCNVFRPLWTENNCQDLINAFYLKYPGLMSMRRADHATARKWAYIWDDFGRVLHVTAVRSVLSWVVAAALREAGNLPLQGTARGIVKLGETKSYDSFEDLGLLEVCNPVLDIHDELLMEVREDVAEEVGALVKDTFEGICKLRIPIGAKTAKAPVWGLMPK